MSTLKMDFKLFRR